MTNPPLSTPGSSVRRAHMLILIALQVIMAVQLVLLLTRDDWGNAFLVLGVMAVTAAPALFKMPVEIPSEIQIVAVLFIFCTLFLGEVHGFYTRFPWWDASLHTGSGLLLGMLGFMIVYILNEDAHVDLHMSPAFVALFAFFFAVGIGAIWEIFEFAMDQLFGTNMQPATHGDPSGLSDTIHDLIVDTIGAGAVSLAGWRYLSKAREAKIDTWLSRFVRRNPQLFRD
jgi:hypothetical protein